MLSAIAAQLEGSAFAAWAAGSAYPLANLVHLLGLLLLVGGIGLVDLRAVGAFRQLPLPALSRYLTPLAVIGLALMLASGSVMFAADLKALAGSPVFRWKLILIAAMLVNAAAFRLLWRHPARIPLPGKAMAAASLAGWLGVATLGRLIAYL